MIDNVLHNVTMYYYLRLSRSPSRAGELLYLINIIRICATASINVNLEMYNNWEDLVGPARSRLSGLEWGLSNF